MHLYMIAQYLNLQNRGEDRFYKLGREYAARGHNVTLFASGSALGMDLGKKKIGLLQRDGITMVAFNVPYQAGMSRAKKLLSYHKFARMAGKQGLMLPKPDLLVAATPPLSSALPAIKLKKHFGIPLVLEVRELWPDQPIQRGTLKNGLLIGRARKFEEHVYGQADRVIAISPEIAAAVEKRGAEQSNVVMIPEGPDDQGLVNSYEQAMKNLVQKDKIKAANRL